MNIRPFYSGTVSEKIKLKKSLSLLDYGDDTLFDQLFFNVMGNRIADVFQRHEKKQVDHEKKFVSMLQRTEKEKPLVDQS